MLKNFLLKQFLKSKLKGVPEADIERILTIVEKNPDFFTKMGEKLQSMMANGMSQDQAMQKILSEYGDDLKKIANN